MPGISNGRKPSRPKGSPKTPGSGRQPGVINKNTGVAAAAAQKYGNQVIDGLYAIFTGSTSDAARVSAGRELLDRAYGRPTQPVAGSPDGAPVVIQHVVTWLK